MTDSAYEAQLAHARSLYRDGQQPTTAELAETVRSWIDDVYGDEARAALSELVIRAQGHVPAESFAACMTALKRCPLCDHEWTRHDPEDGMCDAHSGEGFGPCSCGRDLAWMQQKIAALSKADLEAAADARVSHGS